MRSENNHAIIGHPSLQPDILVTAAASSPVSIEAEYAPAASVEGDANGRLGHRVVENGRRIESAIAIRYPRKLGTASNLKAAIVKSEFEYCAFSKNERGTVRYPTRGWLHGSTTDLADIIRLVSVPEAAVEAAANVLQDGIERAALFLDELNVTHPGITSAIASTLGMKNVPQTHRMACAIVANAMVFNEQIAGAHPGIKPLNLTCGEKIMNPQAEILSAWSHILDINYWPIFGIAKDIVEQLRANDAADLLGVLRETAQTVRALGADHAHHLTGRVFQRLIADRKYLATYYTMPSSAALLARLAVAMIKTDWTNADQIGSLRIGDFACGTGALLAAVYEQVAARNERSGMDPVALHAPMMEHVLFGCDVMPAAVHITGSTLSGIEPTQSFGGSRLYTFAYGRQSDLSVKIGSLELLQSSAEPSLFNTSDPAIRTSSAGEEASGQALAEIPDERFDLVIMNPPFTRNVTRGKAFADAIAAAFAAFGSSEVDQRQMADRLKQLASDTCYHGNGGLGTAFAALAHQKVRPGGVIALVLPLSAAIGDSWRKFRTLIAMEYSDITVLSIAAVGGGEMAFSADTGQADCMVLARKRNPSDVVSQRVKFISLNRRPEGFADASILAGAVRRNGQIRELSDGPYGGTALRIGSSDSGGMIFADVRPPGYEWSAVRISDFSLPQVADALSKSLLWLPGLSSPQPLKTKRLCSLASMGSYHLDIVGDPPRGPFDKVDPSPTATFPALWNHHATLETRIICAPDFQLKVRTGMEAKAAKIWARAGRAHLSLDFRFNSQPLAVAITSRKTIGGRAWPNVLLNDSAHLSAFALWSNSTLGLLMYWWHASKQQGGRGIITKTTALQLPVLDLDSLPESQLRRAERVFEEFRDCEFLPAHLAHTDQTRALLDQRVICDILELDNDIYLAVRQLAAKLCSEPTVIGGKSLNHTSGPVN